MKFDFKVQILHRETTQAQAKRTKYNRGVETKITTRAHFYRKQFIENDHRKVQL